MKSLKELFRIGPGPSSSHTIGPQRACLEMLKRSPDADHFRVTLYGSLALTGKGHLTDAIIEKTLAPKPCEIIMNYTDTMPHPNTLTLCAYDRDDRLLNTLTVYSIGGGAIEIEGEKSAEGQSIYPHHSLDEIMQYCHEENIDFCAYVDRFEGENINVYLNDILIQMCRTVDTGLNTAGILPGKLNMERIARSLLQEAITCEGSEPGKTAAERLCLCCQRGKRCRRHDRYRPDPGKQRPFTVFAVLLLLRPETAARRACQCAESCRTDRKPDQI